MLTSCGSSRRVNYLQDLENDSQIELEHKFQAVIQPHDELFIQITSPDEELSKPFLAAQQGANSGSYMGYLVDANGNIQIPVIGNFHAAGLTRLELQDSLTERLKRELLISEPFVTARFLNFKIFVVGATTGRVITITNERCTFLEALAMCGDLTDYVDRSRIAVVREINGKMVTRYLDPRTSAVINDPFFMLHQNDIIVLQNRKIKNAKNEIDFWLSWLSVIGSVASVATSLLIYNSLYKK